MMLQALFLLTALLGSSVWAVPTGVDVSYTLPSEFPHYSDVALDRSIISLMEKYQVAGMTAAVITNGQPIWTNAYGWLNISEQRPFRQDSMIRIASMSKSVTATALMQMYDRGFIHSLDEDVSTYLGYKIVNVHFPNDAITLRQLLTHTSSLLDDYLDFVVASYGPEGPKMSLSELVTPGGKYYNETELFNPYHRPGDATGFVYSNLNPIIIATVIEKLTYKLPAEDLRKFGDGKGMRFDQYVRAYIFGPLGMAQTSFNVADLVTCPKTAAARATADDTVGARMAVVYNYFHPSTKAGVYVANAGLDDPAWAASLCANPTDYSQYVPGTNGALFGPQGGIRTTARDYARYQLMHINQGILPETGARVLSAASAALMQSVQWKGDAEDHFFRMYGFYLQQTDDLIAGKRLVGHTGDAYGMQGIQFFSPAEEWGIVMFCSGATRQTKGVFPAHEYDLFNLLYRTFVQQ